MDVSKKNSQATIASEGPLVPGVSMPKVTASRRQVCVLALDGSYSMAGTKIVEVNAAAHALVAILGEKKNRDAFDVVIVRYADDASVQLAQKPASQVRPEEIDLAVGGSTNITAGLTTAHAEIRKAPAGPEWGRPIVLVMTDGQHNVGAPPQQAATALKQIADVIAVAFGADADLKTLESVANSPKHVVTCTDGASLRRWFATVASTMSVASRTGQNAAALLSAGGVVRG